MNVLIIGNGGREHALAWCAERSGLVEHVYVAPGNAGTSIEQNVSNVDLDPLNFDNLVDFARDHDVGLTLVGPEAPLVAGVVDRFEEEGLVCFGPSAAAARLEGSKAFSKAFMKRHDIPTAAYEEFTDANAAVGYLEALALRQANEPDGWQVPIVIKADGLAAGKGVILARSAPEAEETVRSMLAGDAFGDAGRRVVIEEFMPGEEATYIVLADGEVAVPFATSQDHKTRDEGDVGPNTGGLGAYSPAPVVTPELDRRILNEIVQPTLGGMVAEGHPYRGFLYVGLMIGADGAPRVVEYNCRFGDPEAQPVLSRLKSDLVGHCLATMDGRLADQELEWDSRPAMGVVMACGGYPGKYRTGDVIDGLDAAARTTKVFHAGTRVDPEGRVITNGGRVLCVTGLGADLLDARSVTYEAVDQVRFADRYFRRDIGHRAIGLPKA